jgi:transcriptional regulator with XRE-family HTH domain
MELRLARKIAGLTQHELADRAGVDHSFISLLENGERNIQMVAYQTVVRIARALGVEPDDLFPVSELPRPTDDATRV